MRALTIVARNYLPQARVLAASFLATHPGASFTTLVLDGTPDDKRSGHPGDLLLINEIGLNDAEWQSMAAIYDVMELATALKPAALRHLLTSDNYQGPVAYIDPDIRFFTDINDVFEHSVEHGIALTPHVLTPMPRDGRTPDEGAIRSAGIFNLGFICVGPQALPFLDWWHERLRTDAIASASDHLFTDQRWIDWVPALFDHYVERDAGLNVAYWNIHERYLSVDDDSTVLVNGEALRFFHFSGFDPERPWVLSKHAGPRPRASMVDDVVLQRLCLDYAELLVAAGWHERAGGYGFSTSTSGVRLDMHVRRSLRELTLSNPEATAPNPFAADTSEFDQWLASPIVGAEDAMIGPWEMKLYEQRPDLQIAFPDLQGPGARRFRNWLDTDPTATATRAELGIPKRHRTLPTPAAQRRTGGWNVVGYLSAELGVGEAGRRTQRAIEAAGLPVAPVGVAVSNSRSQHRTSRAVRTSLDFRDSVYCANADMVGGIIERLEHPDKRQGDARRIGLWFWELTTFPAHLRGAAEMLDEIWVASDFYRDAIQEVVARPIEVIRVPVERPSRATAFRREHLGLPDGFLFAFSFDFNSVPARKNPTGVIAAYCAAFGPDDGAQLVVKSINGHRHVAELERLRWAVRDRADITIIDSYWSPAEMAAFLELTDCFVSLHRSEGFGLHLADAMAAGTAVIATGYGGNMDFMDEHSALLVPYTMAPVGKGSDPYPATAAWAEPDLDIAAEHLRAMFDDTALATKLGEAGQARVMSTHSVAAAAEVVAPLLHPGLLATNDEDAA